MKKLVLMVLCGLVFAGGAHAETIHIGVDGLVCAFCVKGIEKGFGKQDAVSSVNVDLDERMVTVVTKDDQTLDDAAITDIITDAGYTVTMMHRQAD